MSQLIHDSFFGRLLRYLSKGKLLPHEEAKNPELLKQFTTKPADNSSEKSSPARPPSDASTLNNSNGDLAEKGRDPNIVGWYGPDDPEVGPVLQHSEQQFANPLARTRSIGQALPNVQLPLSCAS